MLSKEFEKLDTLTVALNKSLGKITVDATGLRKLTTAANATNRAFEKATISAAAFQRHLSAIQATGGGIPRLPGGGGGGNAYRGSGNGLHGGNIHLGAGGVGLGTVGMATGDFFWPLAATGAAMYGGKALFESAKQLDTEKQKFRLLGLSEAQNQEAFNYVKSMKVYGSTQTANMAAFREAQGVFREAGLPGSSALEGAKLAAPVLAKLDALAATMDDESAARMHASNLNMLRYVESSGGLKSAADFNRIADFGYKLNVSSGGQVDWSQLRQLKARAGAAGFNLTDDALARLEPAIGELKGGAVGFGLSTQFNRMVAANKGVPTQMIHELLSNGLWDKSRVVLNSKGGFKNTTDDKSPMNLAAMQMLNTNPELFYEKYIKPIYDKMKLDSAEIGRQNVMLFGTTGGRLMTLIDKQLSTIHKSVEAVNAAKGIDEATKMLPKTAAGNEQEFIAAWTDFKTQFGTVALPFFTDVLKAGSTILRTIGGSSATANNAARTATVGTHAGADLFGGVFSIGESLGGYAANKISLYLNADAKKMGIAVTPHVSNQQSVMFQRPQTGLGGFDSSMSATPAGGL